MADLPGDDIILCQITSQHAKDGFSVSLTSFDFSEGTLPVNSNIRPNRIFTADKNIIIKKSGTAKMEITQKVIQVITEILK